MSEEGNERAATTKAASRKRTTMLLLLLVLVAVLAVYFLQLPKEETSPVHQKTPGVKVAKVAPKTAPKIEQQENTPQKQAVAQQVQPAAPTAPIEPPAPRTYTVRPGECLWTIAGRPDVYGDPHRWHLLYLANPEVVDYFYRKEGAPFAILEPGVDLQIPDLHQAEKMQQAMVPAELWVVQFSANRILRYALATAAALKYPGTYVYVMEDTTKGAPWYVVRLGFFRSKEEAEITAKQVAAKSGHQEYLVKVASAEEVRNYLPFKDRAGI